MTNVLPFPRSRIASMSTSEAVYFEGAHFAHIVAWEEERRLERIRRTGARLIDRRRNGRTRRPL